MLDGTICRLIAVPRGRAGVADKDIGRSRGGLTTTIGAAVCATTQKIVRVILVASQLLPLL